MRFDEAKIPIFRAELMNNSEVLNRLSDLVNAESVDSIVNSFTTFMNENSKHVFGSVNFRTATNSTAKKFKQSEWFNNDCKIAKREFKTARNALLRGKNDANRKVFVKKRTKYNRVKRLAKNKFKRTEGKAVSELAKSNPKKFWKSIKKRYKKKSSQSDTLSAQDFLDHFKEMYGGPDEQSQQTDQPDLGNNENHELDSEISDS